jgi:cytochrome b561
MTDSVSSEAPPARYAAISRALHWLTVLLVLTTIPAGQIMIQKGLSRPLQDALFTYHKNIGPLIFLVVVLRLIFRAIYKAPPLPASVPPLQAKIAETVHGLIYVFLIVQTVSGYIRIQAGAFPLEIWDHFLPHPFGKIPWLETAAMAVHYWSRFVLVLLLLAHIGAATMHGLFKRDGVFSRMWPPL